MTNNPRIYLWIAVALMAFLNYDAWERDYGPRPDVIANTTHPAATGSTVPQPGTDLSSQIPQAPKETSPSTGSGSSAGAAGTPAGGASSSGTTPGVSADASGETSSSAPIVHVRTDVLDLDISTRGGTIQRADLPKYPKVKGEATPVRLENQDDPTTLYVLQTGLTGPEATPSHLTQYTSDQSDYQLGSSKELKVPLTWTSEQGVKVTKTYVFRPGEYRIGVEYNVENHSDAPWTAAPYAQILRNDPKTKRSMFNVESYAFHGPAIYDGNKYRKLDTADRDDDHLSLDVKNGWIAALQHHFVSAIVPPKEESYRFTLTASADQFRLAAAGPAHTVAPGATASFGSDLFVGPKLQRQLKQTSPELARVTDYNHLYILAQPLF